MISLTYIDHLQRQNADDLAFYPLTTLEKALEARHVISCEDNGEPAGYLWFGALRGGYDVTIYQAAVDYDSRRRHLGWGMVAELTALATAAGCTGIRLKCASSAESNEFWVAAGFYCTRVQPGGIKRGRDLNCYRTDLQPGTIRAAGRDTFGACHRPDGVQPHEAGGRGDAVAVQSNPLRGRRGVTRGEMPPEPTPGELRVLRAYLEAANQ
jgi:hypothetical protein